MAQITYDDKVALNENPSVAEINKVTDNNMNEIKNTINTNTPVGSISLFAGKTAPNGWLICDGSAVSRTTYANLFSVIGTTYGKGDGSTTFNIPNLKGKVPVGLDSDDTSFDTIGKTGGEKTHTLTRAEMPSHQHLFKFTKQINTPATGNEDIYFGSARQWNMGNNNNITEPEGGDAAHNNLQPYEVMAFWKRVS